MTEGFETLLQGCGREGVAELRQALARLWEGNGSTARLASQERLKSHVYRLRVDVDGARRALVAKCLAPEIAQRNGLVIERWLPAVDLADHGPRLVATAAEAGGSCVWHVYEEAAGEPLNRTPADRARVRSAIDLLARLHTRFAGHARLGECRLWGGDLGSHFFFASVRDALHALDGLDPASLGAEHRALRDRLRERLARLREEGPARAEALARNGGPETLLHGDLWTKNILVAGGDDGPQACLIDWDHAAVGPVSYDLSTFLLRFPPAQRAWIVDAYQQAVLPAGWRLPPKAVLNDLFDTAEQARIANRVIWPALALLDGDRGWGFDALAEIERWFQDLEPVLP